jgi:hypothetical protein
MKDEKLYWFEKEHILCNLSPDPNDGVKTYHVINGGWSFKIKNGKSVLITGEVIHKNISEAVELTREEFAASKPGFGF